MWLIRPPLVMAGVNGPTTHSFTPLATDTHVLTRPFLPTYPPTHLDGVLVQVSEVHYILAHLVVLLLPGPQPALQRLAEPIWIGRQADVLLVVI